MPEPRRPPRNPLEPPAEYDVPASIAARMRTKIAEYLAQLDAHRELLAITYGPMPRAVANSLAVLRADGAGLAWASMREGEHAAGQRRTVRRDPPDPDRVRTPLPSTRPTPLARDRQARAVRDALGMRAECDPDATPVPVFDDPDEQTLAGFRRRS